MKILYLVHQFYPERTTGTEKFILQLAQRCQAAGHEVKVVTYDATYLPTTKSSAAAVSGAMHKLSFKYKVKTGFQRVGIDLLQLRNRLATWLPNQIVVKNYVYQGIPVLAFAHQQRLVHPGSPTPNRYVSDFARELLQRERPDLLHVGHMLRGVEFVQVAAELRIPYVITLTDFWVICPNCKLLNERQQLCAGPRQGKECQQACPSQNRRFIAQRLAYYRNLLKQAAYVVAPARFLADKLRVEFGELPLTVIPYGTDTTGLKPNQRRYPRPEPLVFLFAGTLYEMKGIHLLLKAFQGLTTPNIRLEVYGAGPLEAAVRQQAGEDARIHFGGLYTTQQLSALLQQIDVVVVPSIWHENLPLIMQEAQASGVPTLVADVGGMTECVTDGVNGFTFRVGDVADLQRKMQMITDQPEILNRIKENIRNPKPGQYQVTALEDEAALYIEQYEKILADKARQ